MCPATDNPASCEIRDVIRFLHAKNVSFELCAIYYQNMSEGAVTQGCRMFSEQMFTMKSEVVGRLAVVSDDLVQSVD
jgi:hypothetical protein